MPFTRCNQARLLVDGEATFAAIFAGVRAATRYVLVQFFIIRDDALGAGLATLLEQKARAGVPVYLLYELGIVMSKIITPSAKADEDAVGAEQ